MAEDPKKPRQDEKEKKSQRFMIKTVIISSAVIIILAYIMSSMVQKPSISVNDPYQEFYDEQTEKNAPQNKPQPLQITDKMFERMVRDTKVNLVEEQYLPTKVGYNISFTLNERKETIFLPKSRKENFYDNLFAEHNVKITPISAVQPGGGGLSTLLFWIGMIFLMIFIFRRMGAGGQMGQFKKMSEAKTSEKSQNVSFDDVAGCDEAKAEVKEVVDFLKNPENFTKLGAKMPGGIILIGPPGCGKTLLAKAVATEAGVPFHSMSGSQFVQMFVGVGASRVRDLFDKAEKDAPCIVFIDEIESIGRKRGGGFGGGGEHEIEQTLNELLQRMDGFNSNDKIVILGATNQPDQIDPALMRPGRMDRQVIMGLPDLKGRMQILAVHAKTRKVSKGIKLETIAKRTPGFSGADLANVVNESAIFAARKKKKRIEMEDMEEAIDKVVMGAKQISRKMNKKEMNIVACHEAGHALVAEMLENVDPVYKISIIPRGIGALGQTMYLPEEDKNLRSAKEIIDIISAMLGGRVAEEITFNDVTTGATDDLQRANALAKDYVCRFGMDSDIGLRCFGEGRNTFIGSNWIDSRDYSEKTAREIDTAIKKLLKNCEEKARAIISEKKYLLDELREELLAKETLGREDVVRILGNKKQK